MAAHICIFNCSMRLSPPGRMGMPKKHQDATRRRAKKSATAASTSALLAAVSLLGASLGVSVVTSSSPAEAKSNVSGAHLKDATIMHRKGSQGYPLSHTHPQRQNLQSNQYKSSLQSNQYKSPTQTNRR